MHEVPRLCIKVVRGFRGRSQDCPKARITKTARTPTDKSVWGKTTTFSNGHIYNVHASKIQNLKHIAENLHLPIELTDWGPKPAMI